MCLVAVFLLFLAGGGRPVAVPVPAPRFGDYPAGRVPGNEPAVLPRLRTREERQFRTVLRRAVTRGYGVVDGGTEHERVGANFAGHTVLVQWGCGVDCMEAAVIDITDGAVLALPTLRDGDERPGFRVPTGSGDLRSLRFQTGSRLLGIPNVADGKVYFYVLNGHRWTYLRSEVSSEPGADALR